MKKAELRYLQRLAELYPTIGKASTEIINLQSILNLPKGTEHFMSDLHGEYEAFSHVLRNGQRGFPLFVGTRQQDREDVQHDDAARVDQQLHGSEKRVVELKIDAGRREQYEQQVCGRTQNPLGRDGQNREDEDHRGEKGETGLL